MLLLPYTQCERKDLFVAVQTLVTVLLSDAVISLQQHLIRLMIAREAANTKQTF